MKVTLIPQPGRPLPIFAVRNGRSARLPLVRLLRKINRDVAGANVPRRC